MGKTGVFLDEEAGRYEFLLAGVQVAHVSQEQYDPLTREQRRELAKVVWTEVFKGQQEVVQYLGAEMVVPEAMDA